MSKKAILLALFAMLCAGILALVYQLTREPIAVNQQEATLSALHQIIAPDRYNNDILQDQINVISPEWLGSNDPLPIYIARLNGEVVAVILTVIAPNGYNGAIRLLVGVNRDGSISGVRAIAHNETPGLGDQLETSRSDWIYTFNNQSLASLTDDEWRVRKDGGIFDQWTGATITPRAVVMAIHHALIYVNDHFEALFDNQPLNPMPGNQNDAQ